MKIIKKLIALGLALTATFGCLVGCGDNEEDPSNSGAGNTPVVHPDPVVPFNPTVEYTDYGLVENGKTEYRIVLPDDAGSRLTRAYDELNSYFMKATGANLPLIRESATSYTDNAKLIVLGDCDTLQSQAGVTVDYATLGLNGYRLETKGQNLFIAGGDQYGTLFGVHEVLRRCLNFEAYAVDKIEIDTNVRTLKLPEFSENVVPDIQQLAASYGEVRGDTDVALRLGYEQWDDIWMFVEGSNVHNFFKFVDPKVYPMDDERYSSWYGNDQLCLSNEDMYQQALLPKLKQVLLKNPDMHNVTITQNDNSGWCACDDCKAEKEKYGTDAGIMVKFMNKVSRDIDAWFESQNIDREVNFIFFAYNATTEAPTRYNDKTGKYEPIDEEVVAEDNVIVYYAPIFAKYPYSFYDEINKSYRVAADGWSSVCKQMHVWAYETNFKDYLVAYNTFNSMQENYQFYKEHGVSLLMNQGQTNQDTSTGFARLKIWLNSKLRWNVNYDVNALVDKFFTEYYGEASEGMKEYFDRLRVHFDYQDNVLNLDGTIYSSTTASQKYYKKGVLDGFMEAIDRAYTAIEPLKTSNPERYNELKDRVDLESVSVRYLLSKIYSADYSDTELYELRSILKKDMQRLGITRYNEQTTIDSLYSSWGI